MNNEIVLSELFFELDMIKKYIIMQTIKQSRHY